MHSSNSRRSSVTSTSSDSSSSSTTSNSFTHNNPSHLMKSKTTKNEEDDNDVIEEENIDDLEEELDRLSNDDGEEEEHDALFEMDDLQSSTKTTSSSTITSIRSSLSSSLLSSLTNTSPTTITTMTTPTLSHLASPSSSTSSTPIANSPTTTTASSSTTSSAATTPTSSATTTPTHFSSSFAYNNNNNNNTNSHHQQQQQQCSAINIPLINTSKTSTGGSLQPPKSPHHHHHPHHHHSRTTNKSHHHHVHTKYVTPQQVANMVVLQPPIQDKVLPLLLIDLRSYDEYCSSHIEWSINMQIPDKLVSMSDDELIQLYHSTMNSMMMNSDDLLHASPRRRSNSSANTISPMSSPRRSSNMNINNSMNSSNSTNSMGGGGSSGGGSSIQSTPIMIRPMRARSGSLSISPNTHYLSNAAATTTVNGSSTMLGTSHSSYYASAAHPSSLSSSLSSLSSSLPSSPSCSPRMTSADPAAESILKLLEVTCFPEKVFESKFQWRHLSHAVLFVDCDDHDGPETEEDKRKKRVCRWLYRLLKREHKIKALSILKSSFQEFQRSVPFLITNKRHKEYDFPTIINSFMYLGTHRMLTQPGGIDVLMKRKLGVQFVLNCAHECGSVIPESYLEAGKFTYKKIDLESEVEKPLSESLSFEKIVEIIQFIEGARKRHRSLECNNTNSAPTTPVSDSDSSTSSTRELPNRRLSIGSSARESAKLFIHCHEGRCRGVAVCCIYFMVRLSWNLNTCLQFFRVHRPLVSITEQYMKWLQRFDHMMSHIPNRHEIPLSVLFTEIQQRWATEMQEQPITPDESNNPKSPSNK